MIQEDLNVIYNEDLIKTFSMNKLVEQPKVSVIVPAYNTEKYIFRCLLSLIKQTLKEIEIIVVDDGSTDDTAKIANKFAEYDSRVKIILQKNLRQGCARNNGTKIANGVFIGYVDSDDWVDLDYFEKLYNAASKHDADIALATNVRIGGGKTKKRLNITEEKLVSELQDKIDVNRQWKNECQTNKIYRLSMLKENNVVWPEGTYCEDKLFTIMAIYYANAVVAVPDINYYYYRNPTSTVNTRTKEHYLKLIEDRNNARRSGVEFLREKNAKIRDKNFWAIRKEVKIFGKTFLKIKESLHNEKYYIFSVVKIWERKI